LECVIVPDITADGAYDEAVKGVDSIIHIASPLPMPSVTDYKEQIIVPATRGTVGMLQSAMKAPTVKRIVITASIGSIVPGDKMKTGDSTIYNGMHSKEMVVAHTETDCCDRKERVSCAAQHVARPS
jgi:nucleoside-diphosphate-sugar epimerase